MGDNWDHSVHVHSAITACLPLAWTTGIVRVQPKWKTRFLKVQKLIVNLCVSLSYENCVNVNHNGT